MLKLGLVLALATLCLADELNPSVALARYHHRNLNYSDFYGYHLKHSQVLEYATSRLGAAYFMWTAALPDGVDVMIIIFGDFCQVSTEKLAFFSKTNIITIFFKN
jgi:hypothetical protein